MVRYHRPIQQCTSCIYAVARKQR